MLPCMRLASTVKIASQLVGDSDKLQHLVASASARCFVLTAFQIVDCQCTGGYTTVSGDIYGVGTVNGYGGMQIVASCSACNSLCDQQGSACLSTECSPSTLQCNLNSRSNVDTTINYQDFIFCVKSTGDDFMVLHDNIHSMSRASGPNGLRLARAHIKYMNNLDKKMSESL